MTQDNMTQDKKGEYGSLMDGWTNFNSEMGDRLMENVRAQQQEYESAYGKWMDISQKMGDEVTRMATPEGEGGEVFSVWKNYNNLKTCCN